MKRAACSQISEVEAISSKDAAENFRLKLLGKPCIVCYDRLELEALKLLVSVQEEIDIELAKSPIFNGTLDGQKISLVRIPFGDNPDRLTAAIEAILEHEHPTLLLSIGTAMACQKSLKVGDFTVTSEAQFGNEKIHFSKSLNSEILRTSFRQNELKEAQSLTSSVFIQSESDRKNALKNFPQADIIEMEDFHLAKVALKYGVQCASIRAITDFGDFDEHKKNCQLLAPELARFARRVLRQFRIDRLGKIVKNPFFSNIPFYVYLRFQGEPLSIPAAVEITSKVVKLFGFTNILKEGARLDIAVVDSIPEEQLFCLPSGNALVSEYKEHWKAWVVCDFVSSPKVGGNVEGAKRPTPILGASQSWRSAGDEGGLPWPCEFTSHAEGGASCNRHACPLRLVTPRAMPPFIEKIRDFVYGAVFLKAEVLGNISNLSVLPSQWVRAAVSKNVSTVFFEEPISSVPDIRKVHIQGLNSISAEAEEGLLACTTIEEFAQSGFEVVSCDKAQAWVYRTACVSDSSYFCPEYPTPMRIRQAIPSDVFLIATGLGPAVDPGAQGGKEAHLLWLGDEQGGRLINYLEDISSADFEVSDVFRYDGVAQKLGHNSVALSRLDRQFVLTEDGLNSLSFEPSSLRAVYSPDYDRFLRSYFAPEFKIGEPCASYLLLTSRGCGHECSICCSGGFRKFASLRPEVFSEILRKTRDLHELVSPEFIDIYLLDSNFNKFPERVKELSLYLENRNLLQFFRFFIRHNSLKGFLKCCPETGATTTVDVELIRAYRRLGVNEIILGIDSYTETSIRILKTEMGRLINDGFSAQPTYRVSDIEAVIAAIEAEGLKSRCFLLMNNPFVGDHDRIETFYTLLRLALRNPNFKIDFESSTHVNELKPFLGAPITRIARQIPGLIQQNRFSLSPKSVEIENFVSFDLFGNRRATPEKMRTFVACVQSTRLDLGNFLLAGIPKKSVDLTDFQNELVYASRKFIEEDEKITFFIQPYLGENPKLIEAEDQIEISRSKLRSFSETQKTISSNFELPQLSDFFKFLKGL